MNGKEEKENRMRYLIMEWEAKIAFLLRCADKADGECKDRYVEYIASLQEKQDELLTILAGYAPSSNEAAQDSELFRVR